MVFTEHYGKEKNTLNLFHIINVCYSESFAIDQIKNSLNENLSVRETTHQDLVRSIVVSKKSFSSPIFWFILLSIDSFYILSLILLFDLLDLNRVVEFLNFILAHFTIN